MDAIELINHIRTYYNALIDVRLNIAEIKDLYAKQNQVIVIQDFIGEKTLQDILVEDCKKKLSNLLDTISIIFSSTCNAIMSVGYEECHAAEEWFEGFRLRVGYDWQPANMIEENGKTWLFDLVYPLILTKKGLPYMELRHRNYDTMPALLAYYIWFHPLGIIHNLAACIGHLVANSIPSNTTVFSPRLNEVKKHLKSLMSKQLKFWGFNLQMAEVLDVSYETILSHFETSKRLLFEDILRLCNNRKTKSLNWFIRRTNV